MRTNFGVKQWLYPQPVLIVATYDENVNTDQSVITGGKVDITKLKPITFDPAGNGYYIIGEKVGNAFKDGLALK